MLFDLLFLAASGFGIWMLGKAIKTILEEDHVRNHKFYACVGAGIAIAAYIFFRLKYALHDMILIYALAVNALWFLVLLIWSTIAVRLSYSRDKTGQKKEKKERTEKKPEKEAEKKPEKEDNNYREAFRFADKGEYGYAMQEMLKAPEGYKDRDEMLREWVPKAIKKGLEHYRNGDLSSALGNFEGVIRYDPDNEEAQAYQTIVTMAYRAKNGGDLK